MPSRSQWIPNVLNDQACHTFQKAPFEIGWEKFIGNPNLLVGDFSCPQNVLKREWKMRSFSGAMEKLEKFRTQLINRQASREKYHYIFRVDLQNTLFLFHFWINEFILRAILLHMLQRAGARAYSNFKAVTLNGESPYEELSSAELAEMAGYCIKSLSSKGSGEHRLHWRFLMLPTKVTCQTWSKSYPRVSLLSSLNTRSSNVNDNVLKIMLKFSGEHRFMQIFLNGYFPWPSERLFEN